MEKEISKALRASIKIAIFENYGLYNELGFEVSDQRGYLTFTCGQGTFIAVQAKRSNSVWFYKHEKTIERGLEYNE